MSTGRLTDSHTVHRVRLAGTPAYEIQAEYSNRVTSASSIAPALRELIKLRASQINGCAFCLDMHWRDARQAGETEARLYLLNAWRDSPVYTDAERVALELTEAVTQITKQGVPDDLYERVRQHFSESEYLDLLLLINAINNWNRLCIATGVEPPMRSHEATTGI